MFLSFYNNIFVFAFIDFQRLILKLLIKNSLAAFYPALWDFIYFSILSLFAYFVTRCQTLWQRDQFHALQIIYHF